MKAFQALIALGLALPKLMAEADLPPEPKPLEKHRLGSEEVAIDQDELSADVQQLVLEQTNPKVVELLGEVENIMDETTEMLIEHETGGATLAAQTEIIEKIHEAAKEKQKGSQSKSGGAMMDMMKKMMGEGEGEGEGEGKGKGKGKKPGQGEGEGQGGSSGGKGQTGESDSPNTAEHGIGQGPDETRRIPKASGLGPATIPQEFRQAFDAYNRGAEELVK
ncbi:MAG: hypothetical protein R3242_07125 [Akkermansiaceae bacterium]|nr:hypothetical protein [Akkermansiaceae bacterium]